MNRFNRLFRQYHRKIAIILALPLLLTVITGMGYTVVGEWFHQGELAEAMLRVHSGEIFRLGGIYPILNGIGLLGLLVTGVSMLGWFRKRPERPEAPE